MWCSVCSSCSRALVPGYCGSMTTGCIVYVARCRVNMPVGNYGFFRFSFLFSSLFVCVLTLRIPFRLALPTTMTCVILGQHPHHVTTWSPACTQQTTTTTSATSATSTTCTQHYPHLSTIPPSYHCIPVFILVCVCSSVFLLYICELRSSASARTEPRPIASLLTFRVVRHFGLQQCQRQDVRTRGVHAGAGDYRERREEVGVSGQWRILAMLIGSLSCRHFLVPLAVAQRPRWRRKGTKLHIYNDHTFVAKHLSGWVRVLCSILRADRPYVNKSHICMLKATQNNRVQTTQIIG